MSFNKKVVVLKQIAEGFASENKPLCGICRVETEDEISTVFLSFVNVAAVPLGEYFLFILCGDGKLFCVPLGKQPVSAAETLSSTVDVESGFAAGLFFVKDDLPSLIAYRKTENFNGSVKNFKSAVYESFISRKKYKATEPNEKTKDDYPDRLNIAKEDYDDEAVATVNYFDQKERKKIESIRTENDDASVGSQKKEDKNQTEFIPVEDETNPACGKEPEENYFSSVKKELDGIFLKFPEEKSLSSIIPESRWAKINYSEDKFYVVGVIKEHGKEKYICYGVPSPYKETPPEPLKGFCSFIPKSVFALKGDGFFIMFQDAVTGKCVNINES